MNTQTPRRCTVHVDSEPSRCGQEAVAIERIEHKDSEFLVWYCEDHFDLTDRAELLEEAMVDE